MSSEATTSYSAEHQAYLRKQRKQRILIQLSRAVLLLGMLGLWELAANLRVIDPFLSSQPSRMWQTFVQLIREGSLWRHIGWTLWETLLGFGLGTFFGLLIAVLLWWFPVAAKVSEPYLVILNSLPKVALGPLFIVWLGTGLQAIVAVALTVSLIVTVLQVYSGFQEVNPHYLTLAISFGANRFELLHSVVLRAALPAIISALKVGVGLSMVGVIVGEFLVAKQGLGYLIVYGGQVFNLNLVMTSTAVLLVLAAALYGAVVLLEKVLLVDRG